MRDLRSGVPELPEVETIRRTLLPRIRGLRIRQAKLARRDIAIAPGDPAGGFSRQRGPGAGARPAPPARLRPHDLLAGCQLVEVLRRGKQLALVGRNDNGADHVLVVQLGMSGQLFLADEPRPPRALRHVHAWWSLAAPSAAASAGPVATLIFRDPRRFGGLRILRSRLDLDAHWSALGPDALETSGETLLAAARGSSRSVKAMLMDQAVLAGVGNIYADEALFRAGVRPARPARRLKPPEAGSLAAAIRAVLGESIESRGTTVQDYRDGEGASGGFQHRLAVYGRAGEPCVRCGGRLRSGILAQRTTVWCPRCQR